MGTLKKYVIGNWLRGYYEGMFDDIDDAWSTLSKRFLLSYPAPGGRHVSMWVMEKNQYGFEELIMCRQGITEINNLEAEGVLFTCKRSGHSHL